MPKTQKVEMTDNYSYAPDGKKAVTLSAGMVVEVPERIAKDIKAKDVGKGTTKNTDTQVQEKFALDVAESDAAEADEAVDDRIVELKKSFEDAEKGYQEEIAAHVDRIAALEGANKEAVAVIKKAGLMDRLKGDDKTTMQKFLDFFKGNG